MSTSKHIWELVWLTEDLEGYRCARCREEMLEPPLPEDGCRGTMISQDRVQEMRVQQKLDREKMQLVISDFCAVLTGNGPAPEIEDAPPVTFFFQGKYYTIILRSVSPYSPRFSFDLNF